MDDIIRCYADVLYLKTTAQLPPQPIAHDPEPERHSRFRGPLRVAKHIVGALARHLDRTGTASALSGKRSFRRIGG